MNGWDIALLAGQIIFGLLCVFHFIWVVIIARKGFEGKTYDQVKIERKENLEAPERYGQIFAVMFLLMLFTPFLVWFVGGIFYGKVGTWLIEWTFRKRRS